jgi:hypothetical protein
VKLDQLSELTLLTQLLKVTHYRPNSEHPPQPARPSHSSASPMFLLSQKALLRSTHVSAHDTAHVCSPPAVGNTAGRARVLHALLSSSEVLRGVCVCVCARMRMCVSVCARAPVSVCMCVSAWAARVCVSGALRQGTMSKERRLVIHLLWDMINKKGMKDQV